MIEIKCCANAACYSFLEEYIVFRDSNDLFLSPFYAGTIAPAKTMRQK